MEVVKKEGEIKGALTINGNLVLIGDLKDEKEIEVDGYIDCNGGSIKASESIKRIQKLNK